MLKLFERDSVESQKIRNELVIMANSSKFRNYLIKNKVPSAYADDIVQDVALEILQCNKISKIDTNDLERYLFSRFKIHKMRYWSSKKDEQYDEIIKYTEDGVVEVPSSDDEFTEISNESSVSNDIRLIKYYRNSFGGDLINCIYIAFMSGGDLNKYHEITSCLGYDIENMEKKINENKNLKEAIKNVIASDGIESLKKCVYGIDDINKLMGC